jgi:hypothetical protein
MALYIRRSSLSSAILSIWKQISADLMFLKRCDLLKVTVSNYCVQKLSNVNGDHLDDLDPHLEKNIES